MVQTARKLNFMIKNEVALELEQLVPPGQRSRLVNESLVKERAHYRRQIQTQRLMALRAKNPKLSTDELLGTLRDDRHRKLGSATMLEDVAVDRSR